MKQRSPEWHLARAGRFTASEIHKLLGVQGLGKTGLTYAFEKACEIVMGIDLSWNVETWDMRRGTETEPEAFAVLKQIMAAEFLQIEECSFFPYGDNAGASPDGIVIGKPIISEIKCPRPEKVLALIRDGESGIDPDHMKQMQMEMLCTNSDVCYYFNYSTWNDKPIYHLIKVKRDESIIEKIKVRIDEAVQKRDEYAQQLLTNKQF